MKTKTFTLFLSLFVLVLLAACGKGNDIESQFDDIDLDEIDFISDEELQGDSIDSDSTEADETAETDGQEKDKIININDYHHLQDVLKENSEAAQQMFTTDDFVYLGLIVYNDQFESQVDDVPVEFPDSWSRHFDNSERYDETDMYVAMFTLESDQELEQLVQDFGSEQDVFNYTIGTNPATQTPTYKLEFKHSSEEDWYGKVYFHTNKEDTKHALVLTSQDNKWGISE